MTELLSVIPVGVLAAVLWLARNLIITRLKTGVQHEFDAKLEAIRGELRTREAEIAATREVLLAAMRMHHGAIEERKLKAIDDVWNGYLALKKAGAGVAMMLAPLKIEAFVKQSRDPKIQAFLAGVFPNAHAAFADFAKNSDYIAAERARPWVTPMVWAVYFAYGTVVGYVMGQVAILRLQENPEQFINKDGIVELVNASLEGSALPKINSADNFVWPGVLRSLETRLLQELGSSIRGDEADRVAAERAQRIVALATAANAELSEQPEKGAL
jgi:hypothetical protein